MNNSLTGSRTVVNPKVTRNANKGRRCVSTLFNKIENELRSHPKRRDSVTVVEQIDFKHIMKVPFLLMKFSCPDPV
jgi:hypothetical protein